MKIGLITNSIDESSGGIGTYSYQLIKNMNILDQTNEYSLIHHTPKFIDIYQNNSEILIKSYSSHYKATVWKFINAPLKLKTVKGLDIVHDLNGIGPLSFNMPFKKIITVHDIIPVLFPDTFDFPISLLHRYFLPKTLENAEKIITVSNCTKEDILSYYNVSPEKIKVIHNAVNERFKPQESQEIGKVRNRYGLNFPFILYVGTLEPRKNIPIILKALHEIRIKNLDYKLVIAGKKGWKYKEIFDTIDALNLHNDVVFTGYVLDEDLPALYSAADLFVYPSLYEGFGLPPLEAMACGTPVITSNTSSLPEVVGGAGITVDPYDVDILADSIYRVLSDQKLKERMVEKGLDRAKEFSWKRCAIETLKVYDEVQNH